MDATDSDWRTTFLPDDRQKLVNKIMDSLKSQVPSSSPKGLIEIATTFEEKMYKVATSESDYLRKISMTLSAMETKSQTNDTANTKQSNSDGVAQKPPNPASQSMQSQDLNQGQSHIPLLNQSQAQQQLYHAHQQFFQAHQQMLSRNVQNTIPNTGVQSLLFAVPSVTNMQSSIAQNSVGSSISQGIPPNYFSLAPLMRGMQQLQQFAQQQQQQQSQNPQLLHLQQRQLQLEQQFQYHQECQRRINQHMKHLQQQLFQQQQIPQLQQQFQQLTLQQ